MSDGIGLAEALLGLPGFRVLEVVETDDEVVDRGRDDGECGRLSAAAGCAPRRRTGCVSTIRDLPCFGRPARLVWSKRRWRCREPTVSGADVDRDLRARRRPGGADPPGRGRGVPPGR